MCYFFLFFNLGLNCLFWPLWCCRNNLQTTLTHNNLVEMANVSSNSCLSNIQQLLCNDIWSPDEWGFNIHPLLAQILVSINPWGKYLSLELLNAPSCSPAGHWPCLSVFQWWVGSISWFFRGFWKNIQQKIVLLEWESENCEFVGRKPNNELKNATNVS